MNVPPTFYTEGLWRSWTRNFKTKHLALLDLIDNSVDAAIQGQACVAEDNDCKDFRGKVHVYLDRPSKSSGNSFATGLCIKNNCAKRIRPLEEVLEVYSSSKTNSGAADIGENGVGLKQGAATLSDLSFVLVKNDSDIELGIISVSLQSEEGCL